MKVILLLQRYKNSSCHSCSQKVPEIYILIGRGNSKIFLLIFFSFDFILFSILITIHHYFLNFFCVFPIKLSIPNTDSFCFSNRTGSVLIFYFPSVLTKPEYSSFLYANIGLSYRLSYSLSSFPASNPPALSNSL